MELGCLRGRVDMESGCLRGMVDRCLQNGRAGDM